MKAIILALALLQLSLSTPNPETKIAEKPKEYKVITKQNLGNGIKRRLGLLDSIKKAWNLGKEVVKVVKEVGGAVVNKTKEVGKEVVKAVGGVVVNKSIELGNEVIDKLGVRIQFNEFSGVFTKFLKGPIDMIKELDFLRNRSKQTIR